MLMSWLQNSCEKERELDIKLHIQQDYVGLCHVLEFRNRNYLEDCLDLWITHMLNCSIQWITSTRKFFV